MGVGVYSSLLAGDGPSPEFVGQTAWTIFWAIAYGGVALALLLATLGDVQPLPGARRRSLALR